MANPMIGKPKYGSGSGNFDDKKKLKLEAGVTRLRILPPFGSLADKGHIVKYHRVHWGYGWEETVNDGGKVSTRFNHKPFECIQEMDFRTKMVTKECPACKKREKVLKQKEESEQAMAAKLVTTGKYANVDDAIKSDEVKNFVAPLTEWVKAYNVDSKFWANVMTTDRTVHKIGLPSTAKKSLFERIKSMISEDPNFDPCGIETGVWFDFNRIEGKFFYETKYEVSVGQNQVTVNGKKLHETAECPLTEADLEAMMKGAWDLGTLFSVLTYDQVRDLVESDNDPEVCKAIFGAAQPGEKREESPPPARTVAPKTETATVPAKSEAPATSAHQPVSTTQGDDIAALKAKLAAMEALQAKQNQVQQKTTAPTATKPDPLGMSDEAFLDAFGQGGLGN